MIRVGNRIIMIKNDGRASKGKTGTIVEIHSNNLVAVDFDENIHGHDCSGLAQKNHGWNVETINIKVIDEKEY